MKKVLVLFLGMVMSASMMWADNAPKKVEKSTEDKPQTVYVEVYLNDLSGEVLDRLAQEGALLKQAFMTYSPDGSRLYKVIVLSSDLKEKVMYLTEDGRVVGWQTPSFPTENCAGKHHRTGITLEKFMVFG